MTKQELLNDEAGLDRFAEADIVGDAQVHSWYLERPHDGVELVVIDRDAGPERCLQRARVGGLNGAPPHSIESCGVVEVAGGRPRKRRRLKHARARFDLPYDVQVAAEAVVFDGREVDDGLRRCGDGRQHAGRLRSPLDVRNHPVAITHQRYLANFRNRC